MNIDMPRCFAPFTDNLLSRSEILRRCWSGRGKRPECERANFKPLVRKDQTDQCNKGTTDGNDAHRYSRETLQNERF